MRENITIKQMEILWSELELLSTIGEWKAMVGTFRDAHKLTDSEAIQIANKRF